MTDVSGATKVADPTWNLVGYTAQYQQRVQLGATAVVVNALIDSSQDAPEMVFAPKDEPVSVAEQKAAGVAPEDTVTKAEQAAGAPVEPVARKPLAKKAAK
jgi:thiazole synthase ThiGH ThiG subunit